MPDLTYQPKTYRKQGGDEFVVADGGILNCESGSTFTQDGTLTNSGTLANTGTITNSSDGTILDSVSASTLSAVLTNHGISTVGSSSGTTSYTLAAPVAGVGKTIGAYAAIGGNATVTSTAATIGSTQDTIVVAEAGGAISLVGLSATRWSIVGKSTGASVS